MGNFIKWVIFFIGTFSIMSSYSQNPINIDNWENGITMNYLNSSLINATLLAPCDPPVVTSPIYLCQNSTATPIVVTPSAGGTLSWYGTNATGGTASPIAPTPNTSVVGTTNYYVSQTIAGCTESPRVAILIDVRADTGDTINIICTVSASSIYFDWAGITGHPPSAYNYSYTIQGGATVTGNTDPSSFDVTGLSPGQSVTLTVTSVVGFPCIPPKSLTCTVPCGATTVTPNFAPIPAFCSGTAAPILDNSIASPNGITGTWSPSVISNTVSGSYVFTPNSALFPCATTQTLVVTVIPRATPTFNPFATTICQNATPPPLLTNSTNTPPITGVWNPAVISTATLGTTTYTFTPNPGQCVTATPTTVSLTIVSVVTPNFVNIPPLCSGSGATILTNTSPNGITGTWSPSTISNTTNGSYLFTPDANQCATTQTLNVTIIPRIVPDFPTIPSFCTGTAPPLLVATSPNGIDGTWSPTVIDNTINGSYIFTPDPNQCATTQTLDVIVNPLTPPDFDDIALCLGDAAPVLGNTSPNGITGIWSPTIVDSTTNGTYVFTPNANECASSQTITVTVNQATLIAVDWTVSDAFLSNQIVTIIASAPGNYLYQLDYGLLQSSPVFENVASGTHTITVYDANGCSPTLSRNDVLVINYPKFFTPNGDSFNETWNIFDLQNQLGSTIYIFDRYGKLLKQISPSGVGWDGTYNGEKMPSSDYWFRVEYTEQNISKEFRAHFSLKR